MPQPPRTPRPAVAAAHFATAARQPPGVEKRTLTMEHRKSRGGEKGEKKKKNILHKRTEAGELYCLTRHSERGGRVRGGSAPERRNRRHSAVYLLSGGYECYRWPGATAAPGAVDRSPPVLRLIRWRGSNSTARHRYGHNHEKEEWDALSIQRKNQRKVLSATDGCACVCVCVCAHG